LLTNRLVGISRGDSSGQVIRHPLRALQIAAILLSFFFHSIPCSAVGASSQKADPLRAAALESYPNIVVERRVEIPLRDGVKLRATLFRPDTPGRFPAIVYRTPYGQEDYAAEPEFPIKAAQRGYLVFPK
jgi:predicted acyl esterase